MNRRGQSPLKVIKRVIMKVRVLTFQAGARLVFDRMPGRG